MPRGFARFAIRRILSAALLVVVVSSAALMLVRLAPGDPVSGFDVDPARAEVERHRLGLDRPIRVLYLSWLTGALRLDFGESIKYRRPVSELVLGRAANTALLGASALTVATLLGIPAGIVTGSRRGPASAVARGTSVLLLSVPPLVTSFVLLLIAARTGWLPVGGFGSDAMPADAASLLRYLVIPTLALALPLAATIERLQSQAIADALLEPCLQAARARGCSFDRLVWRHAWPLSLGGVLSIYGVIVGAVLSGSFAVEIVTSWPGLGALMYDALVARDLYLAAGCATVGAALLAGGVLASDLALAAVDPRVTAVAP